MGFEVSNWRWVSIDSCIGLAPSRQKATLNNGRHVAWRIYASLSMSGWTHQPKIIQCVLPLNETRRYIVMFCLIGWPHTQNDPWLNVFVNMVLYNVWSPVRHRAITWLVITAFNSDHDDVIKWKHVPRYWPFVCGNSLVTGEFPTQRPVTRSFMFSLICAWINSWVNNREAGDLRRHRAHYDVIVM